MRPRRTRTWFDATQSVLWSGLVFVVGCYQPTVVPPLASIPRPVAPPVVAAPAMPPQLPELTLPKIPLTPTPTGNPWTPKTKPRDWKYVVLHHTAAEEGSVESIHEIHLKNKDKSGNPWLGIGYHFVIGNGKGMGDGEIEPTFRWREQLQGAHAGVGEYNQQGIGIVLIGNFEKTAPTAAQLTAVKRLVGVMKQSYSIDNDHVVGHGDVKATECPGRKFPLNDVRISVAVQDEPSFPSLARGITDSPLTLNRLNRGPLQ